MLNHTLIFRGGYISLRKSVVIKCAASGWKWYKGISIAHSFSLMSCESSFSEKENPDEKKLLQNFCIRFI